MAVPLNQATRIGVTNGGALGATTTTASFSWNANELLIMTVASALSGGGPVPTSITGGTSGLTFTLIDSQGAGNVIVSVWRAMSTTAGSGTTVITWNGATRGLYELEGFSGAAQGSNGANAIIQTVKTSAGSQTAMSMSFAATPRTDSLILAACNHNDSAGTMTAGTNFTGVADATDGTAPVEHIYVEENPNGSAPTTVGLTSSVAGNFGFVAIEIAPIDVFPTSIASAEAVPTPALVFADIYGTVGDIASAESVPSPLLVMEVTGVGDIGSAEAVGIPFISSATGVWPAFYVEAAFTNKALDLDANVVWTDLTPWVRAVRISRSRSREQARFDAGSLQVDLDNRDLRFSPELTTGANYPNIRPNKRIRVRADHNGNIRSLINAYANSWSEQFSKPRDAIVTLDATDAFKLFARFEIPDSWALAVTALNPYAWYRLNETSGTVAYDAVRAASFAGTYSGATYTLAQNPIVPGANVNTSKSVLFAGATAEMQVSSGNSPIPTTTGTTSIVYRNSAKAFNTGGASSLAVGKPTGTLQTDVMLAFITIRGDKSITGVPTGWTLVKTAVTGGSNNDNRHACYWKAAGASEPSSYTWTFDSSGDCAGIIVAYQGVDTTSPIDAAPTPTTNASTSATTCVAPSATSVTNRAMLVTGHAFNPTTTTSTTCSQTPPAGMTERADTASKNTSGSGANRATVEVNELSVPTAGTVTGTKTSTFDNGMDGPNVGISVILKPTSAGAGAVPTPFTTAFWFEQTADQGNNDPYIAQGAQAGANSFDLYQRILTDGFGAVDSKLAFRVGNQIVKTSVVVPVPPPSTSPNPLLVVARYDGATTIKLDTFGSSFNTSQSAAITVVGIAAAALDVGKAECSMDEVTIWQRALTDAEVVTLGAIALGTVASESVVASALDLQGWPADLRQIAAGTGGVVVPNLTTGATAGTKLLDYLQSVTDTERGALYMTGEGKVAYETLQFLQNDASRSTIVATFGKAGGEIGYSDLTPDYSDQIIVNDVQITNTSSNNGTATPVQETFQQQDLDSSGEFSRYTLSISTTYDGPIATRQANAAARMQFELDRYKQPQRRIQSITIEGTGVGADWDTLLTLTMLQRVRVNHVMTVSGPAGVNTDVTIAKDYTIRGFDWEYTASPKSVKLTLGLDEGAIASTI